MQRYKTVVTLLLFAGQLTLEEMSHIQTGLNQTNRFDLIGAKSRTDTRMKILAKETELVSEDNESLAS
jgi:hypothetical protein